jgi:hypothetical protein
MRASQRIVASGWRHPGGQATHGGLRKTGLTYSHIGCMVNHMKTTLNISDVVMRRLKREAARRGKTMSELVEGALRAMLDKKAAPKDLPPLPRYSCGRELVDIADRDALYDAMERHDRVRG